MFQVKIYNETRHKIVLVYIVRCKGCIYLVTDLTTILNTRLVYRKELCKIVFPDCGKNVRKILYFSRVVNNKLFKFEPAQRDNHNFPVSFLKNVTLFHQPLVFSMESVIKSVNIVCTRYRYSDIEILTFKRLVNKIEFQATDTLISWHFRVCNQDTL